MSGSFNNAFSSAFDVGSSILGEQSFSWDIFNNLEVDFGFSWNVGDSPFRYYYVTYGCQHSTCSTTGIDTHDSCTAASKQTMFQIVMARNIEEVCAALPQDLPWQISSIKVSNQTVYKDDEQLSDSNCFEYTEVPDWRKNASCFNRAVDEYHTITMGSYTSVDSHIAVGSGKITVSGTANVESRESGNAGVIKITGTAGQKFVAGSEFVTSVGGKIILSGEAHISNTSLGTLSVSAGFYSEITDLGALFAETEGISLSVPTNLIKTECANISLPLLVGLSNNISFENKLSDFLQRNGQTFPTEFDLRYNKNDQTWRSVFHFVGDQNQEKWDFVFEWRCENVDRALWRFSLLVKMQTASQNDETRLLIWFSMDPEAYSNRFIFTVGSQDGDIATNIPAVIDNSVYYDKIGMFKSDYWLTGSKMKFILNTTG